MLVKVERVVDIVQNIFKMSSALVLLEGTPMSEVPFSQLQGVLTNILTNVKIVYAQGKGSINAQEI